MEQVKKMMIIDLSASSKSWCSVYSLMLGGQDLVLVRHSVVNNGSRCTNRFERAVANFLQLSHFKPPYPTIIPSSATSVLLRHLYLTYTIAFRNSLAAKLALD
jgi:hypothetical protein